MSVDDALIGFERLRLHARENMVGVRLAVDELVAMRHCGPSSVTGNDDSHHLAAATADAAASESGDDDCDVFVVSGSAEIAQSDVIREDRFYRPMAFSDHVNLITK